MENSLYYRKKKIHRVLIIGLGISGMSVARYLSKYATNFDIFDHNTKSSEFQIKYHNFDKINFHHYDLIVVAPGIPINKDPFIKLKRYWEKVIGDIELFIAHIEQSVYLNNKKQRIIAITGSNGKSTVVKLLGYVLKRLNFNTAIGGNIGIPALEIIDDNADIYLLEISSFQIDLLKKSRFNIAVVLNLSSDHLDRYPSPQTYFNTKLSLLPRSCYGIMNAEYKEIAKNYSYDIEKFSYFNSPRSFIYRYSIIFDNKLFCKQSEILLQGHHNLENILSVLVVLKKIIVFSDKVRAFVKECIASFSPLAHRCSIVKKINDVSYINDSKATNIASVEAAIKAFGLKNNKSKNIILLLGGVAKGDEFSKLVPVIRYYVKKSIIYGKDSHDLFTILLAIK